MHEHEEDELEIILLNGDDSDVSTRLYAFDREYTDTNVDTTRYDFRESFNSIQGSVTIKPLFDTDDAIPGLPILAPYAIDESEQVTVYVKSSLISFYLEDSRLTIQNVKFNFYDDLKEINLSESDELSICMGLRNECCPDPTQELDDVNNAVACFREEDEGLEQSKEFYILFLIGGSDKKQLDLINTEFIGWNKLHPAFGILQENFDINAQSLKILESYF